MVNCHCGKKAVFSEPKPMCRLHFELWLKKAICRELGKCVTKKDRLAVAVSGGKDSTTLLEISSEWARRKGIEIFGILVDEGVKNYREFTRAFLSDFCRRKKIELHIFEFRKEFGKTLDEFVSIRNKKKMSVGACTICGTFRRYILNKYARKFRATKILLAHNRDDEVQTFLMNLSVGNLPQMATKGELGGIVESPLFVVRFKPAINIPEKAMKIYSLFNHPSLPGGECPYMNESFRSFSRKFVNNLEEQFPNAKSKMLEVYLSKLLPSLKSCSASIHRPLRKCAKCGEPTSGEVCKACDLLSRLG